MSEERMQIAIVGTMLVIVFVGALFLWWLDGRR